MKLTELPESAFAVYSEKLKQKKKSKPIGLVQNGTGKVSKKKNPFNNSKGLLEMKEIGLILEKLASKEEGVNKNSIKNIYNTNLQKNKSGKGNKTSLANNWDEKLDQNLRKGKITKAQRRKANRKARLNQQLSTNYNNDVVVHMEGIGISKTIKNNLCSTKISISKAQNEPLLRGKSNKKIKHMPSNQSSIPTMQCLRTIQNLEFEVEKPRQIKINSTKRTNKKHIVEGKSSQLKIQSERYNTRSTTQVQKLAVNKKGIKSMSNDWTNQENSIQTSKRLFEWLILPIKGEDFLR